MTNSIMKRWTFILLLSLFIASHVAAQDPDLNEEIRSVIMSLALMSNAELLYAEDIEILKTSVDEIRDSIAQIGDLDQTQYDSYAQSIADIQSNILDIINANFASAGQVSELKADLLALGSSVEQNSLATDEQVDDLRIAVDSIQTIFDASEECVTISDLSDPSVPMATDRSTDRTGSPYSVTREDYGTMIAADADITLPVVPEGDLLRRVDVWAFGALDLVADDGVIITGNTSMVNNGVASMIAAVTDGITTTWRVVGP